MSNDPLSAADLVERVWRDVERTCPPDDEQSLHARNNLAVVRTAQGRTDEAVDLLRECVALRDGAGMATESIVSRSNLGQALKAARRVEEAERVLREAAELARARLGDGHVETINVRHNLAGLLLDLDRLDEASAIQREIACAVDRELTGWPQLRRLVWLQRVRIESRRGGFADCAASAGRVLPALVGARDGARAAECAALGAAAWRAVAGPSEAARWLAVAVEGAPEIPWSASAPLVHEIARLAEGLRGAGEVELAERLVRAAGIGRA